MRDTLQKRCDLFIENRDIIKSAFRWKSTYIYPLCASLYSSKGMRIDAGKLQECKGILEKKTGAFSNFRGVSKMATVTMLSLSSNPEGQMENMLFVYENLKEVFWGSQYLAVAAATIVQLAEPYQYKEIVQRTRDIYNRMKNSHPFLTNGEDSAFAALLAMTELDNAYLEQEMKRCYIILNSSFFSGNAVQSISQVLALGEESAEHKCAKALELFQYLKNHGYKYGTSHELATLRIRKVVIEAVMVVAEDMG